MRDGGHPDMAGEGGLTLEPLDTGDFGDDPGRRQFCPPLQGQQVGCDRADMCSIQRRRAVISLLTWMMSSSSSRASSATNDLFPTEELKGGRH
jgi:hypothetical protein